MSTLENQKTNDEHTDVIYSKEDVQYAFQTIVDALITSQRKARLLEEGLQNILSLDYTEHPTESNEWAEAAYFNEAQKIARNVFEKIQK